MGEIVGTANHSTKQVIVVKDKSQQVQKRGTLVVRRGSTDNTVCMTAVQVTE